jgi:hypothetical protein
MTDDAALRHSARTNVRARRSPRRGALLAVLLAAAVIVVIVVLASSGGSKHAPGATTPAAAAKSGAATPTTTHAKPHHRTAASSRTLAPANAAEISLAVLNATETTGLAHRVSSELQQSGYSQASALSGRPPGTGQQTVVQYTNGHRSEAEAVAHSLSVGQVQPIESAVSSLAGSATVVVIVGADKAG